MNLFRLILVPTLLFLSAVPAKAVCPLCTVAVAGGLGISRWLGIDDSITGVWVGGLILSSGFWLSDWIGKRNWNLPHRNIVSIFIFYLLVIPPLYWAKLIGLTGNTIWGIDKILFGSSIGMMLFLLGFYTDKWLRTKNAGKVFIYYQKVILPVFLLTLGSFVFYLVTI